MSSWSASWRMLSRRRRVWAAMWGRFKITSTHPGKSLLHRRWHHLSNHHDNHLDHHLDHHDNHDHDDHCRQGFLLCLLSSPTFGNWKRRRWPSRASLRWLKYLPGQISLTFKILFQDPEASLGKHKEWQTRAIAEINSLQVGIIAPFSCLIIAWNVIVSNQENVKSFNIEDVGTFDTVSKMKSEISNLRSDLVNQEKLTGEDDSDYDL